MSEPLTVGAAAELLGVTTRTLHHWDAVGLVHPSDRTPAGYRLYTAADLVRAQRVTVYRELGVPSTRSATYWTHPPPTPSPPCAANATTCAPRPGSCDG
ncbi:hypothetical protein NN3_60020 [Nocardia neocaledoniensis NBRC 108232]|uniref:MerR family transcriptional regulator n=1 Tax=Nocardia neocaledoniensis TaxID=236511 RepID=UPI001196A58E|nr:MerR family transcriptional regulator [Nocardia neocaledoniensis]GEM34995.1 hypothetical protein NN3_60020 [Nocardia neocaledoniensis NBRC 108232]